MDPVAVLVLVAYASLVVELVAFPIPSEASTYQLLLGTEPDVAPGDALARARGRAVATKLLVYLAPTALGVALFLLPLLLVVEPSAIRWLLPLPPLDAPHARWAPHVRWLGAALVVAGRALTFTSVLQLRRARRESGFSVRGLFRFSRNPGLVGMYAFYLGLAFLFPCAALFAGLIPYVWNMHRRVLMEESQLVRALGDDYRAYLARVPRYLPAPVGGRSR